MDFYCARDRLGWSALCFCLLGTGACSKDEQHADSDALQATEASVDAPALTLRAAAHDAQTHSPTDATPSPDGQRVYYVGLRRDSAGEDVPGVFAVNAAGGDIQTLTLGEQLGYPVGVATSLDGSQLFVADRLAGQRGDGAVFALAAGGGAPSVLSGTQDYRPAGLTVQREQDRETLYFTGYEPTSGAPGVFATSSAGGAVRALIQGDPLHDPGGIAVASDGSAYIVDQDDFGARVLQVQDGRAEPVVTQLGVGFPAGIALTRDDSTLLVSGVDPATRRDVLYVVDLSKRTLARFTQTVGQFSEAAGLHRAHESDVFAWADSRADQSGTVYVVTP